jgi:hypothetical protein
MEAVRVSDVLLAGADFVLLWALELLSPFRDCSRLKGNNVRAVEWDTCMCYTGETIGALLTTAAAGTATGALALLAAGA